MASVMIISNNSDLSRPLTDLLIKQDHAVSMTRDVFSGLRKTVTATFDAVFIQGESLDVDSQMLCEWITRYTAASVIALTDRPISWTCCPVKVLRRPYCALRVAGMLGCTPSAKRSADAVGATPWMLASGEVSVDLEEHVARYKGCGLPLTLTEFRLLSTLVHNSNEIVSYVQLVLSLGILYGNASSQQQAIRRDISVHMNHLRAKFMEVDGTSPIRSLYGYGYMLVDPDSLKPD